MGLTGVDESARQARAAAHPAFRGDIQGLRAVAVGLVVLSHARVPGFDGGFIGVDVFFVISGFLITGLLLADAGKGRVNFGEFYARRARRILPLATVVILATGVASIVVMNFLRARQELIDSLWAGAFAANIKFSQDGTDYFNQTAISPLQHFWSLAVEEQFYLFWPALVALVLFGAHRSGASTPGSNRELPRARMTLTFALIGAASLVLSAAQTSSEPTAAYFSTFTRAWELVAGAMVAVCLPWLGRLPLPTRTTATWVGLTGIVISAFVFDETTPFPGTAAMLPVLATCAVLIGGIDSPPRGANRLLSRQPLRTVGDVSYSLYLWHWPVLILGAQYLGATPTAPQTVVLVTIALLLSFASYRAIENPFRRRRPFWGSKPYRSLLIWPVSLGLIVVLVVQGWPSVPTEFESGAGLASETMPAGPDEVKAAVLAARRGDPIPSNLTPSVEGIADDETSIGECSGYKKIDSEICQFGDPQGAKTVVLFGNSHAVAWLPAVAEIAKQAGWQFIPLVKEACDYPGYITGAGNSQCHDWYGWATEQLARIHPDLVVMNGYDGGEGWQSAITQAVSDLKSMADRTLMLSDAPGMNGHPIDCIEQAAATLATCTAPIPAAKVSADQTQNQIADDANIEFMLVRPWLCYDESCPLVVGNRVTYADVGHLSGTYVVHLVPVLAPVLKLN